MEGIRVPPSPDESKTYGNSGAGVAVWVFGKVAAPCSSHPNDEDLSVGPR